MMCIFLSFVANEFRTRPRAETPSPNVRQSQALRCAGTKHVTRMPAVGRDTLFLNRVNIIFTSFQFILPDGGQFHSSFPSPDQNILQSSTRGMSQFRILLNESEGLFSRIHQNGGIPKDVGYPEIWQSRLSDAKEFSRSSEGQILLSNLKPIGRFLHGSKSNFCFFRGPVLGQ